MLNLDMTMGQAIREIARSRAGQEAIICEGTRLTYDQLVADSLRLASGLRSQGIDKGDRIVCILPPGPDFAKLFFAAAESGAVLVPLNPLIRPRQLNDVLADAQPSMLVTSRPLENDLVESLSRHPLVVYAGGSSPSGLSLQGLMSSSNGAASPGDTVTPGDLLALLYTSGTTGRPKGAMHTHRSLIAPVIASFKVRELWTRPTQVRQVGQMAVALSRYRQRLLRIVGHPMTFLITAGWHGITGLQVMLEALLMGDRLVVMPSFHPRECLELIQKERVTVLVAVPMAYQVMLSLDDFERYDTSSMVIAGTGTAPCPPDLGREIQQRFGCALYIGFGTTEMGGGVAVTSLSDSSKRQVETVGRPLPGVEIRIVDEQRQELPRGQVGELVCRGDNIMQGYYQSPELSAAAVDSDGWYYTGDLAMLDDKGYLRIVGRKKDLIVRGGQNIYPTEIEHYLVSHPKIREAAVVGIPSGLQGESVWAFIRLEEGAQMAAQEVKDYCRDALEAFKVPSQVRFVADFPRGEMGKPQKFKLREAAIEESREAKTQ